MIIFKSLEYKNFRSAGNEITRIDFLKSPSTLIIGKNGSAKSTIIWALYFCLYGKTYDSSVNKPQLLNRLTNKNLTTEVEFSIGQKEYRVIRGIKPNIFEIYENGNLIPQPSDIKDYQNLLEKDILRKDSKSFLQIEILGKTDYKPFMKLPAGDRRKFVEDLLDIQVFSTMNVILKDKIDKAKLALSSIEKNISIVDVKIEAELKNINNIKENNDNIIEGKRKQIDDTNRLIESIDSDYKKLNSQLIELKGSLDQYKDLNTNISNLNTYKTKFNLKKQAMDKEVKFFEENDNCPTCKQTISTEFKTTIVDFNKSKNKEYDEALDKIKVKLDGYLKNLEDFNTINNSINEINNKIYGLSNDKRNKLEYIKSLNNEINSINNSTIQSSVNNSDIEELRKELENLKNEKYYKLDDINIMNTASLLLKDSGIKTNIIRQYIPIINQSINKYLECLDLYINFELDEVFNETIKSSGMDILTYGCFSEGEKQKIDLALTFAWRDIAKRRNSGSSNLLIMDEVLDGSLDADSSIDLLQILDTFNSDTNIFVISHRPDLYYDKFRSIITFKKVKNFSKIVEN